MPPDADLYLEKMDLAGYCNGETCRVCKVDSFEEFVKNLESGRIKEGDCPHWSSAKLSAFRFAVKAGDRIPTVPMLDLPRPVPPELVELNEPHDQSPLLITGNSEFTRTVLLAVVSLALSPLQLLIADVKGHTVDMAMVYGELTAEVILKAMEKEKVCVKAEGKRIILPGLAGTIAPDLASALGREVETGPVCAAELPLYMGDDFVLAGE
ncbi:MAG: hypothetical protein R6V10_05700 [bacterium]